MMYPSLKHRLEEMLQSITVLLREVVIESDMYISTLGAKTEKMAMYKTGDLSGEPTENIYETYYIAVKQAMELLDEIWRRQTPITFPRPENTSEEGYA